MSKDTLFTTPLDKNARFSFDEQVVACFPDMIRRSVAGYGQILAMIPLLVKAHCHYNQIYKGRAVSRIYDLGCSLGAVSLALAQEFDPEQLHIIGVDNSPPMADKAREIIRTHYPNHAIEIICGDVNEIEFLACDAIVINLTLQFLPQETRLALLQKCHNALSAGGILILTEKTHLSNKADDDWRVERYYDFKRANGYSELEISTKRDALENVLITDSEEAHHQRLYQAGFDKVLTWFVFLNFMSVVAFKC